MTKRRKVVRRMRRAFTLLEVLMVIVILGILAALIVPQFMGTQAKAEIKMTQTQVNGLESTLERFRMDCSRYPSDDEGLMALIEKPDDETLQGKWAGPYLKKPPKDAWGRDLIYEYPGQYNEGSYDLSSAGPNGQAGDDDDITNWAKAD